MSDMTIKGKLAAALHEPPAPPGLVERTVVRAQAIVAGREAERKLEQDSVLSRAEYRDLAAQAVVGRLMTRQMPPANVSANMMYQQLLENDVFCRLTGQTPKEFLTEIRNGMFLRKIGEQISPQEGCGPAQKQAAPKRVKNGPAL